METISINPNRIFTKTEYSKHSGFSRPTIDKMIKNKELITIKVKGAILIKG
tara:strand:+ start:489 stop:641 length:153 start_codon:yes stop_codon:yes gene_type:complete